MPHRTVVKTKSYLNYFCVNNSIRFENKLKKSIFRRFERNTIRRSIGLEHRGLLIISAGSANGIRQTAFGIPLVTPAVSAFGKRQSAFGIRHSALCCDVSAVS
jgi:hypothetical protein